MGRKNYDDILDGIRNGRVFVTLGDLVTELHVTVTSGKNSARIGGSLEVSSGNAVEITIRFLDPDALNAGNQNPSVQRVDLIRGYVTGPVENRDSDTNPSTEVVARFTEANWTQDGDYSVVTFALNNITRNSYIRIRGTNGTELEPENDPMGEDPWSDLWFYSNPIFVEVK